MTAKTRADGEVVVGRSEMWRVNRYLWLSLLFAGVWLWFRSQELSSHDRYGVGLVFALSLMNLSLRSWLALRNARGTTGQLGWAFTCTDVLLIAIAVHITGGMQSDLWLFYFLLVVTETLSVSVKAERLLQVIVILGLTIAVYPISDPLSYSARVFSIVVTSSIARRLYGNAQARSQTLSLLREQLNVEREKSRVAREIHDGVGREIVNATLSLEVARRMAEVHPEEVPAILEETVTMLRAAMEDTRALVFATRSATEWDGPAGSLAIRAEHYARRFGARTGIQVDWTCSIDDRPLTNAVTFGILRIMQESLNNVAKHAHARRVAVSLTDVDQSLMLTIRDDGDGFDPSPNQTGDGGIGLSAMRERAAELGGALTIDSKPGEGAAVTLRIPHA